MLDDLRNSAENSYTEVEPIPTDRPRRKKQFLGMTAVQRFVVALFLLIIVIVLGTFCLLATGKIVLP
ncbi:MAG: hypothetical protein CL609_23870 [Anaerolineaceae bacterium]|nr:hypothetical protein [Anaerolineaceae bacterium]